MTDNEVRLGTRWTHRNRHMRYTVILFTNQYTTDIAKHPVTVVYIGDNGKYWSRPLETWHESMIAIPETEGAD